MEPTGLHGQQKGLAAIVDASDFLHLSLAPLLQGLASDKMSL